MHRQERGGGDYFLGLDSVRLRQRWNKKRPNLHTIWKEQTEKKDLPTRK